MNIEILQVGPIATNCYIIETGPETCLIIDPGGDKEKIRAALNSSGKKTTHIIYTHSHWDHTGAGKDIKNFTGAEVAMGQSGAQFLGKTSELALIMGAECYPAEPDILLKDGDKISSGNTEFLAAETPGHSPGGISLFAAGAIFCGDTIFLNSIGRTDLPGGDSGILIKSIREKIFTAGDDITLYPGHGPSTTVGAEKTNNPFFH